MKRLMIVDNSDIVRKVGRRILTEIGFLVSEARDAGEALDRCRAELPDVAIVDSFADGALELIAEMRRLAGDRQIRIFYCLVENDLKKMMVAKRAGATDFMLKPFDRRSLTAAVGTIDTAA
ncbi:response regulator [Rhizobiaceae bacterium BDR2-2]|uniref:Response regulator n=1 Tax=Ectorhizobium quercum TaxID=2965071 RepID=A0AAE3MZ27_9HYPH|nr:response regulator [Ectorhizobium quercum]MCX8996719.1 response regulator [Ectorhizobium quercum]